MSVQALVSVVVPTYKRPEKLVRCVDSILGQTYQNIEIIVVDDNEPGSEYRRETARVMSRYDLNGKITYLQHETNKGGSAARNTGWKSSSGEFITYIDDDDEIAREKISRQVSCLANLDISWGACYTAYVAIKPNGSKYRSSENRSGDRYIDALMRTMFMGSGSNLLLRKSVVDKLHGYDESFVRFQDIEFLARVLENYKIAFVDEALLTIHQESTSNRWTFEECDGFALHYIECFQSKINQLPASDRERVLAVISLDRSRVALGYGKPIAGLRILINNKVKFKYILRYIKYLTHRITTKESYGFNGL